jgi:hypothetical protein
MEWRTHVFILDGDISKAYDFTQHDKVCNALLSKGMEKILVAAIMREILNKTCKLRLGKLESKQSIPRTRAIWQGDPFAPHIFNMTLDQIATRFTAIAKEKKWGWPYKVGANTELIALLLFADNCWIIATSPSELQQANGCWQSLLQEYGWHTETEDLTYGTTSEDGEHLQPILHNGKTVKRCLRDKGFKVLGTMLTFNNKNDLELERRIRAAWNAFYKNRLALCSKESPLTKRLEYFTRSVHPAFFWCAGSWNLRTDQNQKIRGVQRSMLRKMCHFKRREAEVTETFMSRTNRFIKDLLKREDMVFWDVLVRREIFKWAGWTARLNIYDCSRITLHILLHKNLDWIQTIAAQNKGNQLHCRHLRVWRWESLIYNYFKENHPGTTWLELAQDDREWMSIVQKIH